MIWKDHYKIARCKFRNVISNQLDRARKRKFKRYPRKNINRMAQTKR